VKVIGLGGVGSPVAQGVAQFLGFGPFEGTTLVLIDGDGFEERNRARMAFQHAGNKAVSKAGELSAACGGAPVIVPVPMYVTRHNVHRLVSEGDCLLAAIDNHATRKLLDNRCGKLRNVLLISGGNDGIEEGRRGTFANVIVYERVDGRDVTNPLGRLHPEIARPKDKRPDELGCAALASAAPQLVFTNLACAAAMLGAFYSWLMGRLEHEEIFLDILEARMHPVKRALRDSRRNGASRSRTNSSV
jgi:hypothetical protein